MYISLSSSLCDDLSLHIQTFTGIFIYDLSISFQFNISDVITCIPFHQYPITGSSDDGILLIKNYIKLSRMYIFWNTMIILTDIFI